MYGIISAPAIWQRTIENILKDIKPGVAVFLDILSTLRHTYRRKKY